MSTIAIFWTVLKMNAPEQKYSIPALFSAMVMGISYPLFAIALSSIIEVFAMPGTDLKEEAYKWSLVFLLIGIGTLIFSFLQQFLFGLASSFLTERLRRLLFAAILRQEIGYFDREENSTGTLTSKLSSDAQNIQGASGATLGTTFQILTNLIGGMVIGLLYGWKLALVAIACLPVMISAGTFRISILIYFYEKNKRAYESSAQLACEAAGGIKTIQSLTYEDEVQHRYDKMLEEPLKDGFKNAWLNSILYAIAQSINFVINALIFWYGGQLLAYEGYGIRQFMTVFVVIPFLSIKFQRIMRFQAVVFSSMSAGRILAFAPDLNKAKSSAMSIISTLDRKTAIDPQSEAGMKPKEIRGGIEFQNITFQYPERPDIAVLKNLDIKAEPGQFIALVGPSESGKSTTIQLLERFYDPSGGEILLDNVNISDINIGHYRNMIGLVSQEPNLFDMSVLENICLGLDIIPPMEDIEAACRSANIHDFIKSLEKGYETQLGGKGSQLSGGQKQRIAIARALVRSDVFSIYFVLVLGLKSIVRNPKILLLDEATSALDAESEKIVQQALDAAAKGRTTIAIAHRLSTIQHADIIYVLKDGKVVEQGDHNALFKKRGQYYDLVVQQTLTP